MSTTAELVDRIAELNALIKDAQGQTSRARASGSVNNYLLHAARLADLRAQRVEARAAKMRLDGPIGHCTR